LHTGNISTHALYPKWASLGFRMYVFSII
jgi:hypothetical protein